MFVTEFTSEIATVQAMYPRLSGIFAPEGSRTGYFFGLHYNEPRKEFHIAIHYNHGGPLGNVGKGAYLCKGRWLRDNGTENNTGVVTELTEAERRARIAQWAFTRFRNGSPYESGTQYFSDRPTRLRKAMEKQMADAGWINVRGLAAF